MLQARSVRRRLHVLLVLALVGSLALLFGAPPAPATPDAANHAHMYAEGGFPPRSCNNPGGATVAEDTTVVVVFCAHNQLGTGQSGIAVAWDVDVVSGSPTVQGTPQGSTNSDGEARLSIKDDVPGEALITGTRLDNGAKASASVVWTSDATSVEELRLINDGSSENDDCTDLIGDPDGTTIEDLTTGDDLVLRACAKDPDGDPVVGETISLLINNLGSASAPTGPISKTSNGDGAVTFTVTSDTAGKTQAQAFSLGTGSNLHTTTWARDADHVHVFRTGSCEDGHSFTPGPIAATTGQDVVIVACVQGADHDGIPDSDSEPSTNDTSGDDNNERVSWFETGPATLVGTPEFRTDVNGEARATYRSETPGTSVVTATAIDDADDPDAAGSITINFSGQACDDHVHGRLVRNFQAYPGFGGGVFLGSGNLRGSLPGPPEIATGADRGGGPHVKVFSRQGALMNSWFAYASGFRGGVRVAVGDVTGNSRPEIITAPGAGGGPHIRVRNASGTILAEWLAYPAGLTTGVFVATADVDGDGKDEVITAPDRGGGPHVKVFDVESGGGTSILEFMAYDTAFRGGVRVAGGQVNGDGSEDIVTGAGPGGGPHVRVFVIEEGDVEPLSSWMAYPSGFSGGVFVGVGNYHEVSFDPAGNEEIITGAGATGGPHVKAFRFTGVQIASFFAFGTSFTGGVRVASADTDPCDPDLGSVLDELLAAQGPGGATEVRQYQ